MPEASDHSDSVQPAPAPAPGVERGRKRRIVAGWCVLGLCMAAFAAWQLRPQGPLPIETLPGVLRIPAEDWVEFAFLNPPEGVGWVALPGERQGRRSDSRAPEPGPGWLEPSACVDCHREIVESYFETAHARTMTLPSRDTILGALTPPDNRLPTAVEGLEFEMFERDGEFLVGLDVRRGRRTYRADVPIAFVVGSGNHGQSYLHWADGMLCQLPVSYFSEFDRWTNNPGIARDGTADFARPVTDRCLDCHSTWFSHIPRTVNRYVRSGWILGVTCVRCHGPADRHVAHHRSHPEDSTGRDIINPAALSRDRANEACAQCHSGAGELLQPAFTYVPGDPLQSHLDIDLTGEGEQNDDPHSANQLGRLMRSRCYQESDDLRCTTCHDPHHHERGQRESFSARCANCHAVDDCGARARLGSGIDGRCVECHMPSRRDAEVTAQDSEGDLLPLLRDHLIGKWPEASERIEADILANPSATPPSPSP
ncbi:MAG: hypothetical protein KF774_09915 [Planctomyces sp.]|nr:hypothetical protein [Planctomyces sp.]